MKVLFHGVEVGVTNTMQRKIYKKSFVKKLRTNVTEAEKKLWYNIRNGQLGVKFRRQEPIGRYIVDFVCFGKNLIIKSMVASTSKSRVTR